ncbi:hypothetical protein [Streptomyces sp. NPDC057702]|uniref:hypothetical protein n=1 Tax=unclassified Streptomyces TaxID=2593676 RepID=UPI0036804DBD
MTVVSPVTAAVPAGLSPRRGVARTTAPVTAPAPPLTTPTARGVARPGRATPARARHATARRCRATTGTLARDGALPRTLRGPRPLLSAGLDLVDVASRTPSHEPSADPGRPGGDGSAPVAAARAVSSLDGAARTGRARFAYRGAMARGARPTRGAGRAVARARGAATVVRAPIATAPPPSYPARREPRASGPGRSPAARPGTASPVPADWGTRCALGAHRPPAGPPAGVFRVGRPPWPLVAERRAGRV